MKARGGYSLVEVIVVMGILSLLAAIGTINFREYLQRYRAESQTRLMYQEFLKARSDALYQRRELRVRVYPQRFEVYSTTNDRVAAVRTLFLSFPVCSKGGKVGEEGVSVDFDSRGLTVIGRTICLPPEASSSAVDSVVVSETRVRIGKKEDPHVCDSSTITTR